MPLICRPFTSSADEVAYTDTIREVCHLLLLVVFIENFIAMIVAGGCKPVVKSRLTLSK
jgi:hypothetical protein